MPKGSHQTEEAKRKIGLASMGNKNMLGKHPSEETRKKLSLAMRGGNSGSFKKGMVHSEEFKGKMGLRMMGKKYALGNHLSRETREKMSASRMGHTSYTLGTHPSEETRKKISMALKGKHHSEEARNKLRKPMSEETKRKIGLANKGKHLSEETKKKMSLSHRGEKSYLWRGGIAFGPYTLDWTRTLRRSIRERDKYTCKVCGEMQGDEAFHVHHIDYDKKNCDPNNLVTLCRPCHSKTNFNREYWENNFRKGDL